MDQRLLVIGGTRGTGALIVARLRRGGDTVRVLARNPTRARADLDPAVEIVEGDITRPESLPAAMEGVDQILFTAGVTAGRVREASVRAVTYDGLRHTLAAARDAGFQGRFLWMSTVAVTRASPAGAMLNLVKRNILKWRRRAEEEIRASGLDTTIIRAGLLTNDPAGRRAIVVSQDPYPLSYLYRISRADVAEVFVQALRHPETRRACFNVVGMSSPPRADWTALFAPLQPAGSEERPE